VCVYAQEQSANRTIYCSDVWTTKHLFAAGRSWGSQIKWHQMSSTSSAFLGVGGWWSKLFFVAQSDRLRIRSVVAAWQNLTSKKITQSERISKLRLKPNRTELEPRWWRWKWRWAGHAPYPPPPLPPPPTDL